MTTGRRPSRKPGGRSGPPSGYPKEQSRYADPENWKYPVHTPYHAMAARRYFNKPWNRAVYDPEEQFYVDSRINQALQQFGVEIKPMPGKGGETLVQDTAEAQVPLNIQTASLEECLQFLLGENRLQRAKAISDGELTILQNDDSRLNAEIRAYKVQIDFDKKMISHDCADWKRRKHLPPYKKLCKHIGKILLTIPEKKAEALAKDLISNPDSWTVIFPNQFKQLTHPGKIQETA